jgi:hypothetical protein
MYTVFQCTVSIVTLSRNVIFFILGIAESGLCQSMFPTKRLEPISYILLSKPQLLQETHAFHHSFTDVTTPNRPVDH